MDIKINLSYGEESIHNLAFYLWLVGEARKHILAGDFKAWKDDITPRLMQRM